MKNKPHYLSILAVCLLLGFSTLAQAQQKIAHVDSDGIIPEMPEYQQAKSGVEAYGKILQKELEADQKKAQDFYVDITKKVQNGLISPLKQKEMQEKLEEMQQDLEQKAIDSDKKLAEKEAELTKPLYEKYNAALKKVAEANGYAYIIDLKIALYSSGGQDATDLVKAELGL